ncbi:hypothetical protein ACF0H5_008062 [Mactra antiquata]
MNMDNTIFWLSFLALLRFEAVKADINDDYCGTYAEVSADLFQFYCKPLYVEHGRVCYAVGDSYLGVATLLSARVKCDVGFTQNKQTITECEFFGSSWSKEIAPCEPVPTPIMEANGITEKPDDTESRISTIAIVVPVVVVLLLVVVGISIAFFLWRRRVSRRRAESAHREPGYCNGRQPVAVANQIYGSGTLIIASETKASPLICKGNIRTDLISSDVNSDVDDYENVQRNVPNTNIDHLYQSPKPIKSTETHLQCSKTISADYETAFPKVDNSDKSLLSEKRINDEDDDDNYVNTSVTADYRNVYH